MELKDFKVIGTDIKVGDMFYNKYTGFMHKVKVVYSGYVVADIYLCGVKQAKEQFIRSHIYNNNEWKKLPCYQLAFDYNLTEFLKNSRGK